MEQLQQLNRVYIGCYAESDQAGIVSGIFDSRTGILSIDHKTTGIVNPSFLCEHPNGQYLYAVSETEESGLVVAFRIEENGQLIPVDRQHTLGGSTCYLSVSEDEKTLYAAMYSGTEVATYELGQQGGLLGERQDVFHHGSGPDSVRQQKPHPHAIVPISKSPYVIASDLGIDQLVVYKQCDSSSKMDIHAKIELPAGTGPRHFVYHPTNQNLYVIGELNSTMTVIQASEDYRTFEQLQVITTLPTEFIGENYCADVHFSACGCYLFGSNRGHDSIVVYRVHANTGLLELVGHCSTDGVWPRNFAVSPDGQHLLVANQQTANIVTLSFNSFTGKLTKVSELKGIQKPVCIIFSKETEYR